MSPRRRKLIRRVALGASGSAIAFTIVYFSVIAPGFADAQSSVGADASGANSGGATPLARVASNLSFGPGEMLNYDINYGFINAGTARMEILGLEEFKDRPCFTIRTLARSNSFFSSIFPVNDTVTSMIDAVGLFSWRFDKRLREGSYRIEHMYDFDQMAQRAYWKKDTFSIDEYAQDPLSVLYFVRTLNLTPGTSVFIPSFAEGKAKRLEVKVLRRETVKVDAGEFDCIVVEPLLYAAGIFKHEGKLTVWLTNDRLRMPVLMKSKVLVGAIAAELTDFRLGEIQEY